MQPHFFILKKYNTQVPHGEAPVCSVMYILHKTHNKKLLLIVPPLTLTSGE